MNCQMRQAVGATTQHFYSGAQSLLIQVARRFQAVVIDVVSGYGVTYMVKMMVMMVVGVVMTSVMVIMLVI